MTEFEKRMKAQMDQITANQQRQSMQLQALNQNRFQPAPYPHDQVIEDDPGFDPNNYFPPPDTNQLVLNAVTQKAATDAAGMVYGYQQAQSNYQNQVTTKMERLVEEYPALQDENSQLVRHARAIYSRVAQENPGLDESVKYELSIREAASRIGARPVNMDPVEDVGWTMGNQHNPAQLSKSAKSRLTPQILQVAKLMNIDVNPSSKVGQANLQELSQYSARFNADRDESHVKYR